MGDFQYTSARMNTAGLFSTVYGKFEISAKLPSGQGMWPAFWLLGSNIDQVGWPACGEIDIMEWIGDDFNAVHFSTHGIGFDTSTAAAVPLGWSDNDNFHTYGVNWQPGNLQFYVDNNTVATVTPADINGATWPFDGNNMFIILSLAVDGNWPDTTQFPQQFVIDYVRVYELASGNSGPVVSPDVLTTSKASNTGRRVCKRKYFRT
jgi:beta-glucanase (GH16 family)